MNAKILYESTDGSWQRFIEVIQQFAEQHSGKNLCDIGGGANPVLSSEFIRSRQIDYTILDISKAELDKAPADYKKVVQDIAAEDGTAFHERFDLVFSRMLAEHLRNGQAFHRNIFHMLKAGGLAIHYFPTLYDLPFAINKIIPEFSSSMLLDVFVPGSRNKRGKFRAYYDWCYGPTSQMLEMLTGIGYEVMEFRGLIGHPYFDNTPVVRNLYKIYLTYLKSHPNPHLTSFAQIILRKPLADKIATGEAVIPNTSFNEKDPL